MFLFESLSLLCTLAHRVAAPRLRYPRANIILKPKFSRKLLFIISCSSSWPPVGTETGKGKKRISRESSIELLLYLSSFHTPFHPFSKLIGRVSKASVRWRSETESIDILRVGWKIARRWKGCYYTSFNNVVQGGNARYNTAVASSSP